MIKIKIFQKKALIPLIVLCVILLMIIIGCTTPPTTGEARKIRGSDDYNPRCGDNRLNPASEECDDGNKVNGDGCDAACIIEFCGDGEKDPDEECDGSRLGGETCGSLGQLPGTLGCTALCKFDFTSCDGRISTRIAPNTFEVRTDVALDPELNADAIVECFPEGDVPMESTISNGGMWLGVGEECTDLCGDPNKDCIVWLAMDPEYETGLSFEDDSVSYVTNSPNDELIGYSTGQVTVPPACGDGPCNGNENCGTCPADCTTTTCGDGYCCFNENCHNCKADCPRIPVGSDDYVCA